VLRQITRAYKAILIKTLQIKINITSIDIYLRKLTQKLIINIESRISSATIAIAI